MSWRRGSPASRGASDGEGRTRFVLDVGRRGVYNGGNFEVVHNLLVHCEGALMADNHLPADAAWLFPEYDFELLDFLGGRIGH